MNKNKNKSDLTGYKQKNTYDNKTITSNIYPTQLDKKTNFDISIHSKQNRIKDNDFNDLTNIVRNSVEKINNLFNQTEFLQTKNRLFEINDNLFDIFSNKFLWEESIYKNDKFIGEIEIYRKLGIFVKTSYDFYKYIVTNNFKEFEEEIKGILDKINNEEKTKLVEIKREERIKKEKKLEKLTIGTNTDDIKVLEDNDDEDIDNFGDY